MSIKDWLKKLFGMYVKEVKLPKSIPLPTPTEEDKPAAAKKSCDCDLTKFTDLPPYSDDQLSAGGNYYECPTIAGRDVRLMVVKPNGGTWLLGNLLSQAVEFDGQGNMRCKCFIADGGKYHFKGFMYNNDKPEACIQTDSGVWFPYRTTTFIVYTYRRI